MKILTIGGATRDIFIEHEIQAIELHGTRYVMFPEGKKVDVSAIRYATGGGATNSAVSFKRLGFEVESFFKIGTDHEGDMVLQELSNFGVTTHHVERTNLAPTGTSFMLPSPHGDRAILVYRGANLLLSSADMKPGILTGADHLYITSLSGNASELLPRLAQLAKKNNIPVACNPGTSQLTARIDTLEQALEHIDILILNEYEASLLFSSIKKDPSQSDPFAPSRLRGTANSSLNAYFKTIITRGPRIAVVTNGSDGVYVCDGNKIYYHPSIPCTPISSVGAGDAFGSTFVGFLAQGASIQESIQAGVINAASVLMHLDAKAGLLDVIEIKKQQKRLDPSLFHTTDVE